MINILGEFIIATIIRGQKTFSNEKEEKIEWERERMVTIYAPQSRNCFVPVVNFLTIIF